MKRSKSVKLSLMATASVALTACGEPEVEGNMYRSVADCVSQGAHSEQICKQSFDEAWKLHQTTAPRYASEQLCQDEFGFQQCQRTSGNYWSPFLTGFFVSTALSNASSGSGAYVGGSRPIYRYRDGRLLTSSGAEMQSGGRSVALPKSAVEARPKPAKVMTRTAVISRGGFGARSSSGGFRFGG